MAQMKAGEGADGEDYSAAAGRIMCGPGFGAGKRSDRRRPSGHCGSATADALLRSLHLHFKLQAVVGGMNILAAEVASTLGGFRVRQIVRDVGEPGATGPKSVD